MNIEYNYSANSFTNGINIGKLHNEIRRNDNIKNNFIGITQSAEIITLYFNIELTDEIKNELDDIINKHNENILYKVIKEMYCVITEEEEKKINIFTTTINNGYLVELKIIAKRIDNSTNTDVENAYYEKKVLLKNNNDGLQLVSENSIVLSEQLWNVNILLENSNIIIQLLGEEDKIIYWDINCKLTIIS